MCKWLMGEKVSIIYLYDRKENAERMMLLQGHFPSVQVHNCVLKLQFYERNNLQLYYITE